MSGGNTHDGHRSRLRERFEGHSLESFSDVEALEFLLSFAIPRRDTNVLAHNLLDHFGGFRGVFDAELADLQEVDGIGPSAAMLLRLTSEINRRYLVAEHPRRPQLSSIEKLGDYLMPYYDYVNREMACMLTLTNSRRLIKFHILAHGLVNRVDILPRHVVEIAFRDNAAGVVLSHNHISGTALPSAEDISTTRRLRTCLETVGVELVDHIIICQNDYISLKDSQIF
ncbi:MAG: DNA repair protein RadC [Oscillospiraceae bacterium]|nr:DNA repair protein RadC [Oscillospiraceae bacterium]MCD8255558.1 DNA repair protein RadC [Oscillospiraceae bacterium]